MRPSLLTSAEAPKPQPVWPGAVTIGCLRPDTTSGSFTKVLLPPLPPPSMTLQRTRGRGYAWSLDLPTSLGSGQRLEENEHPARVGTCGRHVLAPQAQANGSRFLPGWGPRTVGFIPWLVTKSKPHGAPRTLLTRALLGAFALCPQVL